MQTYQQQLIANVLKLFAVYRRTKDEAVLEIVEGLMECLHDTLAQVTIQPVVQPAVPPGILIPAQPVQPPWDQGSVGAYAVPGVPPFTYHTGTTTVGSNIVVAKSESSVELNPTAKV